jgi:RNA polymerase sigma-70 factor (ECF subfamily)
MASLPAADSRTPMDLAFADEAEAERAFDAFVREQYSGLLGFLRGRTGNAQDAEDDAQEAFARVRRYRDCEPQAVWRRLLFRIAVNVVHDRARQARTHRSKDHVALECVPDLRSNAPSPDGAAIRAQQVALLTRAIGELPPKCKRVFLLKRVHGLSNARIAELCGVSVKMVEKHLTTALVRIRRTVEKSTHDSSLGI